MEVEEVKKITDLELSAIKGLNAKLSDLSFRFGQIEIQKLALDVQKSSFVDELNYLRRDEKQLIDGITKKYGNISINFEDGSYK